MPKHDESRLKCSFCGKSQDQVKKLIAGPEVYICDECVELCNEILDEEFLEKANILEWEKVEILNINNGERFQTYALKGKRGSKVFCLNGAAARKAQQQREMELVIALLAKEPAKTQAGTVIVQNS